MLSIAHQMKINYTILSLTMVVIASMLIIALGEHTYLANAQIHIKKSTTSCVGDTCHTVVCINSNCHASFANATTSSKIVQNSSIP